MDVGPLDPPTRQTSIVVLSRRFNETRGDYRIVTSLSTRSSTEILEINPSSGALHFATDHFFTDEDAALLYLNKQGFTELSHGNALLGYTSTQTCAGILLATKVAVHCTLPGNHTIYLISEAQWILLPLDAACHPVSASIEQDFWRSLQQHTVSGVHYFCETVDLTRPFPSSYPPTDPLLEFVWNTWLSQPLRQLGLLHHCPVLLQGAVESSYESNHTGQRYSMMLITRRSRRHPGTRYIARGLNEFAGPGNEIEAELVMWTKTSSSLGIFQRGDSSYHHESGTSSSAFSGNTPIKGNSVTESEQQINHAVSPHKAHVRWSRVVWRRGTVPIWWSVELQPLNKGLQAEVCVRERGPYVGMLTYFRGLKGQSMRDARGEEGCSSEDPTKPNVDTTSTSTTTSTTTTSSTTDHDRTHLPRGVEHSKVHHITCINLLHCNPKKASELMLSSHFQEGIKRVKERLGPASLRLLNFDWHGTMSMLSEEPGVEAFWHFIEQPLKHCGLAVGSMIEKTSLSMAGPTTIDNSQLHAGDKAQFYPNDITPWSGGRCMQWEQRQQGMLRFNCADSLDRTNAASCFAMLPVLQEGLRLLGIPLDVTTPSAHFESATRQSSSHGSGSNLPGSGNGNTYDEHDMTRNGENSKGHGRDVVAEEEEEEEEILPEGWERRQHAGRDVYIDHINRATQWNPPPGTIKKLRREQQSSLRHETSSRIQGLSQSSSLHAKQPSPLRHSATRTTDKDMDTLSSPWAFFSYNLDSVRARLDNDALTDYVAMFRRHGDVHSALYTGSPAMHSHVLSLLIESPDSRSYGASASMGKLQNLRVAVQRRWNNTVSDSSRQQSMELFLGVNLEKNCPGIIFGDPPSNKSDLSGLDDDDALAAGLVDAAVSPVVAVVEEEDVEGSVGGVGDGNSKIKSHLKMQEAADLHYNQSDVDENDIDEDVDDVALIDPLGAVASSAKERPSSRSSSRSSTVVIVERAESRGDSDAGEKNAVVSQFRDLLL